MEFQINLNGDTKETFRANSLRLDAAVHELRSALAAARPHGRNYQTCKEPAMALKVDDVKWVMAERRLGEVADVVNDYVATVVKQL